MSDRYRRPKLAFGGWLAAPLLACSIALAQQPQQPALKGEPIPKAGQQESAQTGQQAPAAKEQHSPDLLPVIKGIETAIREQIPKEDKAENERKEKREIADLEAQQDMARWAKFMLWTSAAGLVLTLAGLLMLYGTLRYTRDAAKAAEASVLQARRAAEAAEATNRLVASNAALELRAYLSVLPAGINELIGTQEAMGHVQVKNVGRLPAREVWLHVRMRIEDRDDLKPAPSRGPANGFEMPGDPYGTPGFNVDRAIQPGTQMRQGAAQSDLVPVRTLLGQKDRHVYVWGIVWYSDGRQRRFTEFRHRYAIASQTDRKDWNKPARETRAIIAVDKARFHPYGNNAN
ncbi:MAG: hypothetical protein ACKVP3_18880 [Hyphomicrobiaceae bacterium]